VKTRRSSSLALGFVIGLAVVSVAAARPGGGQNVTPRSIASIAQEEEATPLPSSVAIPIRRAQAALKTAKARLQGRRYSQGVGALRAIRLNVLKAHRAGIAQIGKPPTDQESDETPGPPSVIAVLNLEHSVGMGLVGLFDGMTTANVVVALRYTLWTTHVNRDRMLKKVIGLDPEGAGADYADGMADTVGIYTDEVDLVNRALQQYRLSPAGSLGLKNALTRVRATEAKVLQAFGGPE
jgi:hypothetical protein